MWSGGLLFRPLGRGAPELLSAFGGPSLLECGNFTTTADGLQYGCGLRPYLLAANTSKNSYTRFAANSAVISAES